MAMLPVNRIPEILKRMDLNTSQAEAMKTCFGILAIMSREDTNKTLIAKDGMEIMLNAMTVHIDRTDVQEAGCDLLWSLAFNSNVVKEIIAKFNGAVVLVRALKRHSRSADFLKSACGALSNICQFRANQEAVANQGGLQPLVGSIHVHQTNAKLLPFIFDAIASIIVNNEENARGVSSLGIIPIVVSSLSRHKSSKEVVKSGCHTLAILSDVKGQASKIAFAGGVPIILSLLDLHPHYSDLHRVAAVVLLRMLQESAHVGREICSHDGVRILLTSLEQGGAQQDTVAAVTHILYTITNPASPVAGAIEAQLWHKPSTVETNTSTTDGNNTNANILPSVPPGSSLAPGPRETTSQTSALKGVITVLGQYSTRRDVVRAACRLLTNLSGFENVPLALDGLSVLDRLFDCVYHHQDAKDVMEASVTYLKFISRNKIPQYHGHHLSSFQGMLHVLKIRNGDDEVIFYSTELLKKYLENSRKHQRNPAAGTAVTPTHHHSHNSGINILENEDWCNKFLQITYTTLENYTQIENNNFSPTEENTNNSNPPPLHHSSSVGSLLANAIANASAGGGGSNNNLLGKDSPNSPLTKRILKTTANRKLVEKLIGNVFVLLELLFMYGKVTPSFTPSGGSGAGGGGGINADSLSMKLFQLVHKIQYPPSSENHHHQQALEFLLNYYHRLLHPNPQFGGSLNSSRDEGDKRNTQKGKTEDESGALTSSRDMSPLRQHSSSLLMKSHSNGEIVLGSGRKMSKNPSLVAGVNAEDNGNSNGLARQPSKLHRELSNSSITSANGGNNTSRAASFPQLPASASTNNQNDAAYFRNNKYYPKHPYKLEPLSNSAHQSSHQAQQQTPQRLLENWPNFLERLSNNTAAGFPTFRGGMSTPSSLPGVGSNSMLYSNNGNPQLIDSSTELPNRMHLCYESVRPGGQNIISRCATPVPYIVPPGGIGQPFEHSLTFESEFESGNLLRAVQVGDAAYDLLLRADVHTPGHTQWFYFAVSNTHPMELVKLSEQGMIVPTVRVTFSIVNFTKPDSLFSLGMRPVVYSVHEAKHKGVGWVRSGTDISYRGNSFQRNNSAGEGVMTYYTLSFTLEFHHPKDTILIAYSYPYTMSDYRLLVSDILSRRHSDHYIRKLKLCTTLAGEDCDLLVITDFTSEKEKIGPINIANDVDLNNLGSINDENNSANRKGRASTSGFEQSNNRRLPPGQLRPALFISGRVHPGETPASWMMKGIIEFLTSDNASAKLIRKLFIIFITPMLNPDGITCGNNRCSLAGVDLNRQWKTPIKGLHPTVYALKSYMIQQRKLRDVVMYIDLHGHSRKYNVFMYGCDDKKRPKPQVRIFPRFLSNHSIGGKYVCFADCSFHVKKGRESTARVVVAKEMNIPCSYTLEATFCGSNYGPLKNCHMNIGHLQEVGASLCDAFLQYSISEGYGKNVVNILGPITTTDYQVSNLLQYDPNMIHRGTTAATSSVGGGDVATGDESEMNSGINSVSNSRRGSAITTADQTLQHQNRRFSEQLSVAQDDSDSDDDKNITGQDGENDLDNASVCDFGGDSREGNHRTDHSSAEHVKDPSSNLSAVHPTSNHSNPLNSVVHSGSTPGLGASPSTHSLYHPAGSTRSNKIDLALSIIHSETVHGSHEGMMSHRSTATIKSQPPSSSTSLAPVESGKSQLSDVGGASSAPPSASSSTTANSNNLFFDNFTGHPGIIRHHHHHNNSGSHLGPTNIHGSIVWDPDHQDEYIRPKQSYDSVADLMANKKAVVSSGSSVNNATNAASLNFIVTNAKARGNSHTDKPKPSNVTSSLNATNRTKLIKTLEFGGNNPRSGTSSPSPAAMSTPTPSSPRTALTALDAIPNAEIKGNGATIFKSEYNDMLFHKSIPNHAFSSGGNIPNVLNHSFPSALPAGVNSTQLTDSNLAKVFLSLAASHRSSYLILQDVAIATPFGLPRVNGAQSK